MAESPSRRFGLRVLNGRPVTFRAAIDTQRNFAMAAIGSFHHAKELRKKPRRQFHYQAKILSSAHGPPLPCAIADVSQSGARIVLESDAELPPEFLLLLSARGGARRICRLVWRNGLNVGVEFRDGRS
jgi:hypothetical protein